jgi:type II secretory pathway component HofQ
VSSRAGAIALLAIVGACYGPPPMVVVNPPPLPQEQLAAPPSLPPGRTAAVSKDTTVEYTVTVDTHGRDADVREILGFLGHAAGIRFVFSPDVNRKVRMTLADVPISTAIDAVLAEAGLTLEGTTSLKPPPTPAVVFYQIAVNVDSLSVESIMKRFGVGRAVAEAVVQARMKP